GVAAGRELPLLVGGPVAEIAHFEARREAPRQAGGDVGTRRPDGRQRNRRAGIDEVRFRRVREVAGECEPVKWPEFQADFYTLTVRWTAGLGGAVVADEHELAAQVEEPVGREEFRPRQRARSEAELIPGRGRQRLQLRIGEDGARVVAVKAGAEVAEELGGEPRAEDEVRLDVRSGFGHVARLEWRGRVHGLVALEEKDIAASAGDEADLLDGLEVELHERRVRLLDDADVLHAPD